MNIFRKHLDIKVRNRNGGIPPIDKLENNVGRVSYCGLNAFKILKWLYEDSHPMCRLDRKYETYLKIKLKEEIKALIKASEISNIVGKSFGEWTVLGLDGLSIRGSWKCKCSCGVTKSVRNWELLNNKSKSCGCQRNKWRSYKNSGILTS